VLVLMGLAEIIISLCANIPAWAVLTLWLLGVATILCGVRVHFEVKVLPPVSIEDWEEMVINFKRLKDEQDRQLLKIKWCWEAEAERVATIDGMYGLLKRQQTRIELMERELNCLIKPGLN